MTSTVPEPVIVPVAPPLLMTTAAAGVKRALAFTVIVLETFKFVLAVTATLAFEMVRLPNDVVEEPPIA